MNIAHSDQDLIVKEELALFNLDHQLLLEDQDAQTLKFITTEELNVFHAQETPMLQPITSDVFLTAMALWISFNLMDHASHAVMVTSQILPRQDVLREEMRDQQLLQVDAQVKERSTARAELNVLSACHTLELREAIQFASQINAL